MDEFKEKFARNCEKISLPKHDVGPFYVTPREDGRKESLIIGRHKDVTHLGQQMRVNEKLQKDLKAIGVRFGTRDGSREEDRDRSPLHGKQEKLPDRESAPDILFNLIMKLQKEWGHARDGDINPVVKAAFATKTLQSHHLVEDKIVKNLGRDTRSLSREEAPAVLVAQELHLRYLTPNISSADRERFTKDMKSEEAVRIIEQLFIGEKRKNGEREGGLYNRPGLESLIEPTADAIREIERTKPGP